MKTFICNTLSCFIIAVIPFTAVISAQQKLNKSNEVLYATVTNPNLEFIQNLKQESFLLTEGKKPLKIVGLSQQDEPLSVGILLDISASNKGEKIDKTKLARECLPVFLKNSNSQNEYFLASFANQYNLLSEHTSNIADLQNILQDNSKFPLKGNTSLFDALKYGFEDILQGKKQKRVLILISDGLDNNSNISYGKIKEIIKANDVIIYLVDITILGYGNLSTLPGNYNQTRDLVKISGGDVFTAKSSAEIQAVFLYLSTLLRNQYKIEFEKSLLGTGINGEMWI